MRSWRIPKVITSNLDGRTSFQSNLAYTSTRHNGRSRSIQQAEYGYEPEPGLLQHKQFIDALSRFLNVRKLNADWIKSRRTASNHGNMATP